jgi:hypothetical protein
MQPVVCSPTANEPCGFFLKIKIALLLLLGANVYAGIDKASIICVCTRSVVSNRPVVAQLIEEWKCYCSCWSLSEAAKR